MALFNYSKKQERLIALCRLFCNFAALVKDFMR